MSIYYAPLFDKLGVLEAGSRSPAGDIDGDGKAEVITGAVSQFSLATIAGGMTGQLLGAFFLGTPGGVNVATGDLNGDRRSEIILGTATGAAQVNVYDGASFGLLASFNSIGFPTGVTVAAVDRDGDHKDDLLVGAATTVPFAEIFSGISLSPLDIIYLPGSGPTSGLNVAGSVVPLPGSAAPAAASAASLWGVRAGAFFCLRRRAPRFLQFRAWFLLFAFADSSKRTPVGPRSRPSYAVSTWRSPSRKMLRAARPQRRPAKRPHSRSSKGSWTLARARWPCSGFKWGADDTAIRRRDRYSRCRRLGSPTSFHGVRDRRACSRSFYIREGLTAGRTRPSLPGSEPGGKSPELRGQTVRRQQRQRLAVATCGSWANPESLLFLDEPTTGLGPAVAGGNSGT